jgi:hypothetical protein
VVTSWGVNRLDVFVTGTDGTVQHKTWDGSGWFPSDTGWENLGGQGLEAPAAVSWGADRLDVFLRGMDGTVYHKFYTH